MLRRITVVEIVGTLCRNDIFAVSFNNTLIPVTPGVS